MKYLQISELKKELNRVIHDNEASKGYATQAMQGHANHTRPHRPCRRETVQA